MDSTFDYDKIEGLSNSLGGRVDLLEKMLGVKVRENLRYSDIQKIVKSGFADEFFDIGDEIIIPWTDYSVDPPVTYEVPHVIVHFGDVEDSDGNIHKNAMWLMWKYATSILIPFDAAEVIPETETTFQEGYYYYTKVEVSQYVYHFKKENVNYGSEIPQETTYYKHILNNAELVLFGGSNDWSKSALRQYLNSSADTGEWWVPQHESDVEPMQEYMNCPGFLSGYSENWLNILKEVKVETVLDQVKHDGKTVITYDKFFIPSFNQLGEKDSSLYRGGSIEGEPWEYWTKKTGNNKYDIKAINDISSELMTRVSLRSPFYKDDDQTLFIKNKDTISKSVAHTALHVLPCCVIS